MFVLLGHVNWAEFNISGVLYVCVCLCATPQNPISQANFKPLTLLIYLKKSLCQYNYIKCKSY